MHRAVLLLYFVVFVVSLQAQSWSLVDCGVGLVVEDAQYDTELKIAERGTEWDVKDLYENGALAGKYRGNQRFAAWIKGTRIENSPWYWKYTITFPDGKTSQNGPYGFYSAGHGTFSIPTGSYTEGNWKIDFYVWNKNTQETKHVASTQFTTTYGKPSFEKWSLTDVGIGIYDQTEYDTKLVIVQKGTTWSQKELYEKGYFANSKLVFGTWLQGPPTSSFTDENGLTIWLYSITVTYPNGSAQDFCPYNFYAPGHATMFINATGNVLGEWKIDFYLVHRTTKQKRHVTKQVFTIVE